MAGANNFLTFNENYLNIMSDVDYDASTYRENGATTGIAPTTLHNKMYRQTTVMSAALAAALAAKEIDMLDSSLANLIIALGRLQIDDEVQALIDAAVLSSSTVAFFGQAAAPTGWTQSTVNNDAALRVVSSAGGGSGGTHGFSTPPSTSHTHTGPSHTHTTAGHSLTEAELAVHNHTTTIIARGNYATVPGTLCRGDSSVLGTEYWDTDNAGSGAAHDHGATGAGGTGATGAGGATAFAPKYVDVIKCSKD